MAWQWFSPAWFFICRDEVVYECCGNVSYPSLHFHIWIERKSLYYIVNIITPCVILSLLATFTFCIPPDSGEKISLGITLLLSFTVFQLIVAESIPRRSDSIPIISKCHIRVVSSLMSYFLWYVYWFTYWTWTKELYTMYYIYYAGIETSAKEAKYAKLLRVISL